MDPFIGEIRMFSWDWAPRGWALCEGQLLNITQYTALFALLGTQYGGDGRTTFALPDLRGRAPIHFGPDHTQGEMDGVEAVMLTTASMPAHPHSFLGTSSTASKKTPAGVIGTDTSATANFMAPDTAPLTISPVSLAPVGGNQPHENMQPFLVMNYCIALAGVFPPHS